MVIRCSSQRNKENSQSGRLSRILCVTVCVLLVGSTLFLGVSAAAAVPSLESRRMTSKYYGPAYEDTYSDDSEEFGIFGGWDFSWVASQGNNDCIIRVSSMYLSQGIVMVYIYNIVDPDGDNATHGFYIRFYIRGLGTSVSLVKKPVPGSYADPGQNQLLIDNFGWVTSYTESYYSLETPRFLSSYGALTPHKSYFYRMPEGQRYVQLYAAPTRDDTLGTVRPVVLAFQLEPSFQAYSGEDGHQYVTGFGQSLANFFSTFDAFISATPFLAILGVFVGGCIVVLILKMGVSL